MPTVRPGMLFLLLVVVYLASSTAIASPVNEAVALSVKGQKTAQKSQKKVEQLHDNTQQMLAEYRELTARIKGLKSHNNQLSSKVEKQTGDIDKLKSELEQIDISRGEITPMLPRLLAALQQLLERDLPFQQSKRFGQLTDLTTRLGDVGMPLNRQLDLILKAYKTEFLYGNELISWKAHLDKDANSQTVAFLRLGRIGLYYQTLDGSKSAWWDDNNKRWNTLGDNHNRLLSKAIKQISAKSTPSFITLPLAARIENCCS